MIFPTTDKVAQFFPSLTIKSGKFINIQPQYNLPEWTMHPPMFEQQVAKRTIINNSFVEEEINYTKIVLALKCERVWVSYFWRIFALSTLIAFTLLLLFAIDYESVDSRLGHGVTILLTMVAFQFVVQSYLPNLGYLTILDWYLLLMDGYVVVIVVFSCIPQLFDKWGIVDDAGVIDTIIFILSVVMLLAINIAIFVKIKYYIIPSELAKVKSSQSQLSAINDDPEVSGFGVMNKFTSVEKDRMIYYGNIHDQMNNNVDLECLKWSGIYQSVYGEDISHGIEYQYVFTEKDSNGNMILVARKITGDPSVPAGMVTWKLNEIPVFKKEATKDDTKIKGVTQLRFDQKNPDGFEWGDITLVSATENQIKFNWHMGGGRDHLCVYDRYQK